MVAKEAVIKDGQNTAMIRWILGMSFDDVIVCSPFIFYDGAFIKARSIDDYCGCKAQFVCCDWLMRPLKRQLLSSGSRITCQLPDSINAIRPV